MSMIFLTSDQHFKHNNIIKYCNRPYTNTHFMDKDIIDKYNQVVKEDDICFHLGDLTMENNPDIITSYLNKLNGHKHLILGNHDRLKPFQYVDCGYDSVHTSMMLGDKVYMAHDPSTAAALPKGSVLYHGHVHGLYNQIVSLTDVVLFNVGVDVRGMYPIKLDDTLEIINQLRGGLNNVNTTTEI